MGVGYAPDGETTQAGDMEIDGVAATEPTNVGGHEPFGVGDDEGADRSAAAKDLEASFYDDGDSTVHGDEMEGWVANLLVERGAHLPAHGCLGSPTSYLVVKVTSHGPKGTRVKTYKQMPPSRSKAASRRTRKGDLLSDWEGNDPNWNARFQVPLPGYRTEFPNPTISVIVMLKGGVVDEKLGKHTVDLPMKYTSTDRQPGEVSETGYLKKGDDGWGDCMHDVETTEGHIGRGSIFIRHVFFKPTAMKAAAVVPEVYPGSIVVPNMWVWGLGLHDTHRSIQNENYDVDKWPFVASKEAFDMSRMTGSVEAVNLKHSLVQVRWQGDSQARWYRCGAEATDVVLIAHANSTAMRRGYQPQWNPLDYYEEKDVRHMLYTLRQMHQLVKRMLSQEREERGSVARLEEIIEKAILPTSGWASLYSLFGAVVENYDSLTTVDVHGFKHSWDTEASSLKKKFLTAIFDPQFPSRDRYHLLHACRIINEDIDDDMHGKSVKLGNSQKLDSTKKSLEETHLNVGPREAVMSPLRRADDLTWTEVRRWRDHNTCTPEGLEAAKAAVLEWSCDTASARVVKCSVDRLMPKLVARLNATGERSVVLSRVFLSAVMEDAVMMMYKTERDLRARAGVTSIPVAELTAKAEDSLRTLLAPLYAEGGGETPGPDFLMHLVQDLEEASLLQTAEAIEDLVSAKPRVPGADFIKQLKKFGKEDRHGGGHLAQSFGKSFGQWWDRQGWVAWFTRSGTCDQMEAKHGSAIGEFFKLILFIIRLNLVGLLLWVSLIIIPWIDWVYKTDIDIKHLSAWSTLIGHRGYTEYTKDHVAFLSRPPYINFTSVAMEEGNWFLYGAYPPRLSTSNVLRGSMSHYTTNYRMDAAWTAVSVMTLVTVFLLIVWEIGRRLRRSPSDVAKSSNLEQFKAKWTRTLTKQERYGKDRLSLVDQQLDSGDKINPTRIDQIEEVAELQLLDDEKMTALLSWPVGLNDLEGASLKLDAARQYWELQHALIGYSRADPEPTGQLCSEYNRRRVLTYTGWALSVLVMGFGVWLLYIVIQNRDELDEQSEYIAPFVISGVISMMPVSLKMIVKFLEYYPDPNHALYHSISRQFFAKMFGLVFVALTTLGNTELSERCTINDSAVLFYQLVFMGTVVSCVVNFGSGLAFRLMGKHMLFPKGVKVMCLEVVQLRTPKQYWPAPGHTLNYDNTTRSVTIENDETQPARDRFMMAAEMVQLYDVRHGEDDMEEVRNKREELLLAQHRHRTAETGADIAGRLQELHASEVIIQERATQKACEMMHSEFSVPLEEAEPFVKDKIFADTASLFETKEFTPADYAEDYEMKKVLKLLRKVIGSTPDDVIHGRAEECFEEAEKTDVTCGERIADPSVQLSYTAVMQPLQPGASGYHMQQDKFQQWQTEEHLVVLDTEGDIKPAVRNHLLTSVEKKKTDHLDDALERRADRIIDLQDSYSSNHLQAVYDQLCTERREFKRDFCERVYLRQKKHYSKKVNRSLRVLNETKETMPPASGKSEYDLPARVIEFLYLQALIWAGSTFCPMMMAQGCIATSIDFWWSRLVFSLFHTPSRKPLAIGSSSIFFYFLTAATLCVTLIPTASFLHRSYDCGPHAGSTAIDGFLNWTHDWPFALQKIVDWLFSPYILVSILVVLVGALLMLWMEHSRARKEIVHAYKELATLRAEERENAGFMRRYTHDVQVFQRSNLLLDPNQSIAEEQLSAMNGAGQFMGAAQPVNLSYTKTFSTTMCGVIGKSPMSKLESNQLMGTNATMLQEAKRRKRTNLSKDKLE